MALGDGEEVHFAARAAVLEDDKLGVLRACQPMRVSRGARGPSSDSSAERGGGGEGERERTSWTTRNPGEAAVTPQKMHSLPCAPCAAAAPMAGLVDPPRGGAVDAMRSSCEGELLRRKKIGAQVERKLLSMRS